VEVHKGEVYVQRRAGYTRQGLGSAGVGVRFPQVAREFLNEQRMLVVAGRDAAGAVWAEALYGPPGFLRAEGERTVEVAALPRLLLLGEGHEVGAIAMDPPTRRRMRVNGDTRRCYNGFAIESNQIFSNCPKYVTRRSIVGELVRPVSVWFENSATAAVCEIIACADSFFIGTAAAELGADASHRGGEPGFVQVTGNHTLSWPEYRGNAMFMTLGNLHLSPACGLLFPDWSGAGPALHLTGQASVDWDPQRVASFAGAERIVDFTIERVAFISGPTLNWRNL